MSVVLLGYHNMGCMALRVLVDLGIHVPAVFTHEDSRGENVWFDSVSQLAKRHSIPVYFPEDINHPKWVEILKALGPDVLLSCYFRQMIKEDVLAIPKVAAVNLHGSLLPRYRGRCPVNWQLLNGERISGVTLHHMVLKADAGDIVGQESVLVDDADTAVDLFKKLEKAGERVLRKFIPKLLDGTAPRIPQDHSKATYFGGRRPEDGKIDWQKEARSIYNLIRAVTWPYPGAFCTFGERRLYLWDGRPLEELELGGKPGDTEVRDGMVLVQTGKGALQIISASFEDRPPSKDKEKIPPELFGTKVRLG